MYKLSLNTDIEPQYAIDVCKLLLKFNKQQRRYSLNNKLRKKNFDDIETQLCYMLANASMTKQFTTDVSNQKQLEEENKSLQERIKLLEKENKSLQEENKSLQEQSTTKEEVEELQHKLFITRGQKVSLQDECQLYRDLILKIHHSEMMTYEEEKMLDDVLKPTVSSVLNDNY
jgi:predicted nuclease with TOPRIM domain